MSAKESMARAELAIDSGRALFQGGILVECHAYFALALRCLLDAWAPSDSPQGDDEAAAPNERRERALLAISAANYRHFERLKTAYGAIENREPRATPTALAPTERDVDLLSAEVDRLYRFSFRHFFAAETRRRFRIRLGLALAPIVLAASMVLLLQRGRPQVTASGSFDASFAPEHTVDGLIATEWLLPDKTDGWIDLRFKSPRAVHSVTLSNCHNGGYMDRSSANVRVTAFAGKKAVATAEGSFTKIAGERADLDLELQAKKVTRVRAEVLSYFGLGGGFAEVEVN